MDLLQDVVAKRALEAVDERRVTDTAVRLCAAASPTKSAGPAADALAAILREDGFTVERPVADWPASPAVAVRFSQGNRHGQSSSTDIWTRSTSHSCRRG